MKILTVSNPSMHSMLQGSLEEDRIDGVISVLLSNIAVVLDSETELVITPRDPGSLPAYRIPEEERDGFEGWSLEPGKIYQFDTDLFMDVGYGAVVIPSQRESLLMNGIIVHAPARNHPYCGSYSGIVTVFSQTFLARGTKILDVLVLEDNTRL